MPYRPSGSTTFPYKVTFAYSTKSASDTINKFVAGAQIQQTQQLSTITVANSGTTVREYKLSYTTSAATIRATLTSIQECGGSAGTDCLPATAVAYQAGVAGVAAATGLLDGRRMTTHWRFAAQVQRRFPHTQVDPHVLYVDEGSLLTSAGSASGLDLCMYLVRRDFGAAVANQVACRLIIPPHREGGQAQYVERPVDRRERGTLSPLLEHLQRSLHEPMTNAHLARRAAMSERTLIRRFRATTGMTPADWLTRARIDRVRELLENTTLSVSAIAARTGLGTPSTLRHHFRKRLGLSPVAYRLQFSAPSRASTGC